MRKYSAEDKLRMVKLVLTKKSWCVNTNGKTRNIFAGSIKICQQVIPTGRKTLYFFDCLLDGKQFKVPSAFHINL